MSERYSVILPAEGERLMAAVNQIAAEHVYSGHPNARPTAA